MARAGELWDRAVAGELEGTVIVALDAPIGRRGAKRKVKPVDFLYCVVVEVDKGGAGLRIRGTEDWFSVGTPTGLTVGDLVEVAHEGWYSTGWPRFPRIVRKRADLAC